MDRRLVAIAMLILLVGIGGVAALWMSGDDRDPITAATALLEQERKFDASRQAVESFAAVYQHLVEATKDFPKDCDIDAGEGRCVAINQAASWSLNMATSSARCTQPAIQEARIALLDYVNEARTLDDAVTEPPSLPAIPAC